MTRHTSSRFVDGGRSTVDGRQWTVDSSVDCGPSTVDLTRSGFTLIELIIIIVVASIALLMLLTSMASVVQNTIHPNIMETATELAEQEVERLTGTRYSFVCPQTTPVFYPQPEFSNYSYAVDVRCVSDASLVSPPDPTAQNYKRVIVTIEHLSLGQVRVETIVTNRGGVPQACPAPGIPCP